MCNSINGLRVNLARIAAAAFLVPLAASRTITAGVILVVLSGGQAYAQGILVYVPNSADGTVSVFQTNANGTLQSVATAPATGLGVNSRAAVRGDQAFVYVTAEATDKLHVINTATNTIVQTVDTGDAPYGVTVSPDGTRVYVANNTSNTVSVFSASATNGELTALTTINAGDPRDVVVTPDGTRLYVANQGTNSVQVVDTATNSVVATVTVPGGLTAFNAPFDLALSPDGKRVYVANASGSVSVVDTATNAVIATPATGVSPRSVVVSPNGNYFYVVNANDATISQFDAANNSLLATTGTIGVLASHDAIGAVITPDGAFLYATEFSNAANPDQVRMFSITNGILAFNGTPSLIAAGNEPTHPAICGNGNALLQTGGTFVANSVAALGCLGGNPAFTGGTLRLNANNLSFGSSMSLGSAGGTVNTNGQAGSITGLLSGNGRLTKTGAGTLTLSGNNTYSGGTTINGGTLRLESNNALGSGALTVLGSTIDYGNGLTIGNAIDLQNNVTLNVSSGTATQSGVISGTFGMVKNGGGTLILTGANTYRGGTTISGGTLQGTTTSLQGNIVNNATLVFDQVFGGVFGGAISGAGALVKAGTGTVILGGASTYTGTTTITGGTLAMGHAQALGATRLVTIDANGTLDLNGFSATFNRVDGTGTVALGGGRFTLDIGGSFTFAGTISGNGTFVKSSAGTLTLTGVNTNSGVTNVQAGTLQAGAAGAFSANSTLSVASGATADLAGFSQTVGALDGNGSVSLGSASLITGANNADTTFGGGINGSGSVTKIGTGTWTLSGNNQFTGATTIAGGTLRIGAPGALGRTSGVTVASAGTLDLNGFDHSFAHIGGTGTVALGAAALTLASGDNPSTLSASVTGAGRLVKTGKGVLALTGLNTYTGGTTIQAGSVIGSTSSLQGAIVNHGVVAFDQANDGTYAGIMSGSGALVVQGAGNITLTGRQTYSGGTLVAGGRLTGNTTSLQGSVTVDSALTFDQAFDGLFAGQLAGSGRITKSGAGTLSLSGRHGFSGLTTVTGGTLALNGSLAGSVSLQGGTLTGTGTIGGSVTVGTGATAGLSADEEIVASPEVRASWATAAADAQNSLAALGQLTVGGDLTVGPQGTLRGTVTSSGGSTLLAVAGAARLNGATFELTTQGGNHPRVMQTAVLDAAKGISGQATARLTEPNLEGFLTTSGTTLFLTVLNPAVPLASAAGGANGAAAAGALDSMRAGATGDLRDVTRELAALGDAQLADALDQVAGEIHSTSLQVTAIESEAAADLVRSEGASRRASTQVALETGGAEATTAAGAWHPGRRFWGHMLGQRATLDAAGDVSAASGHTGGFAIGLDWTPSSSWMLGAGGGYGLGELTQSGGDKVDTTAPRAFGYAGYGRGRWTALAGASVAWTSYETERSLAFTARLDPRFGGAALFGSGVDREAAADISGLDSSAWVDGEATMTAGTWLVQPGAGVRFARYGRSAWTETGAGALSLSGPDQSITSNQGDLRLRVARAAGRFRPYGEATYRRELGDGLTATTLQFGPGSTTFDVHGLPLAENRVIGRLGATTQTTGGSSVSFGYRGEAGGGQVRHAVDFAVRFQ